MSKLTCIGFGFDLKKKKEKLEAIQVERGQGGREPGRAGAGRRRGKGGKREF